MMKNTDECPNCGYVFTSEDEEPDYISEVEGGGYEAAKKPSIKSTQICPVCGEKCVSRKIKMRVKDDFDSMEID